VGERVFKPLYEVLKQEEREEEESFPSQYPDIGELLKSANREKEALRAELQQAKSKIEELERSVALLEDGLKEREEHIRRLRERIKELEERNAYVSSIRETVEKRLIEHLEEFSDKLYTFLEKALLEFTYTIPQGTITREELKKLLQELVSFRENLKIYVNPEDLRLFARDLNTLKENFRAEGINLQIFADERIKRGMFKIKGDHFTVERDPKEFARVLFERIFRDVFKRD